MNDRNRDSGGRACADKQPLPWYRYPWPWVAIAIPAIAVIGGMFTLYLAINNPDPLVVDEQHYEGIRSQLQADPAARTGSIPESAAHEKGDGAH
jgi:hypothetical protein